MSILKIIDNVVSPEIFEISQQELSKGIWKFSNNSGNMDTNVSFGADDFCVKINNLILENKLNQSNIIYNLWNSVNNVVQIEKNYKNKLNRIHLNCGPPLYDQTVHQDDEVTFSKNITIVYFIHPRWDTSWGGELLVYDISQSRVIGGSYPTPNRAVIFPSYLPHRGVAVSRISPLMRISIAFQCQYDNSL